MFFFFNDTAPTEIYTLSLHDALPICGGHRRGGTAALFLPGPPRYQPLERAGAGRPDRKSTRLNSSHSQISYAGFCLKKKITESRRADSTSTVTALCGSVLRRGLYYAF